MDIFDQITEQKGDVFDQIAGDQGDIFDTIEPDKPAKEPAKLMAEKMMSQIVGLDRQPEPGTPFMEKHPSLYAAGKTTLAMPGLIEKTAMSVVSGATFSLPERAKEAGEWLSRKLFGEKPEGSWAEDEPVLPSYVEKGAKIAGSFVTIGAAGKAVAAPIISAVTKHKHLAPFARMIGWGTAGATYGGAEKMIAEGELPTPKELVKEGATWAAIEGAISSLGWTGRLAMGVNRLSKLWTIPKKEVLKAVIKEAKAKDMPIAKYAFAKAKTQKALSKKEVGSAKELLDMVDDIPKQFKKKGTYADLTKQLETESIEGRIKSFEKHISETIVKPAEVVRPAIKPQKEIGGEVKGYPGYAKVTVSGEKGTTLGFGPTGQLQSIYEKLMGGLKHKPLKKKLVDVVPRQLSPNAKIVMAALKRAKPFTEKQRLIYAAERGKKLEAALKLRGVTSGEKGYHAELKALEGKMKVEDPQFQPIRDLVTQETVNSLMNQVRDCPVLSNWETYPARKALAQLFEGKLPTPSGQAYLKDVFGKDFVNEMVKKQTFWKKVKENSIMAVNFPKAIKSSMDLSAPLRQGIFMIRRYKQWIPAFKDMFKYFGSKEAYHEGAMNIRRHQNYKLAKDNKLALTDLGSITNREEAFMSSWAEKIPGVGASSRAYTGFLNKLRFDVFNEFVKKGQQLDLLKDPKYLKAAAKYINHATGRGHLLGLEGAATELNTVFFSPRLIMSRLQLINPVFYVHLEKNVRKEALKDLAGFASLALTVGGLAKKAGLGVEVDPRSADFMKVRVGNKRYDILGGFQQPIKTMAQMITGEVKSTTTGEMLTLGEGYRATTRLGVAARFLKFKLSPIVSFGVALLTGQATMGGKVDIPTETGKLFAPMVAEDMVEVFNEEGLEGLPLATPAVFGVGLQTYGGTSTYGLAGRHYKILNTELTRLKTSMGFPSTSVYGQPLTNAEYKSFKNRAGKEIAKALETVMKVSFYKKANDNAKRHILDKVIDHTKEDVKRRMFKRYKLIQDQATAIRKATYKPVHESRKLAEEQLAHILGEG